jgi:alcohol dehydrogenase class IV
MKFEFSTANQIVFGQGTSRQAGALAATLGKTALVVTGSAADRHEFIFNDLDAKGLEWKGFTIPREPTVALILSGAETARSFACDLVIALGGGSTMDSGKAIAALMTNPGNPMDYLEVVGKGLPISNQPAPFIALPTTAGTGAEVTRNAVLLSEEHQVKVSMRSPLMLPNVAIVDPELTYSMPPHITAGTGLDALTQLMEAFVSPYATPMTDALCREGIKRAAPALERAYLDSGDKAARYDMCLASLWGGMALANAKLGAVHGIAGPLGGMFPSPHGHVCGRLLPEVMEANIKALQQHSTGSRALHRYAEIAGMVLPGRNSSAMDGADWVKKLCQRLKMPPLSTYGMSEDDLGTLIRQSQRSSSMQGNPVQLSNQELGVVLRQAM